MRRLLVALLLFGWIQPGEAANPGKDRFIVLNLQGQAAPSPALKFQLLPELAEMQPGNCIPGYLKSFCEQNNFFHKKEVVEERERLVNCPLSDIKPGSLKGYGGSATRQADLAARLEICDWNLLPQMRTEGYMLLLPDLQQLRSLGYAVLVRGRGELVDGDFEGALRSLKTLFALARHTSEHPTLIGGLVGNALAQQACNLLEEFIQQPGAPNLYWALSTMPSPLLEIRRSVSGERMILEASFGSLMNPKRIWTAEDIQDGLKKTQEMGLIAELPIDRRKEADAWLRGRISDAAWLEAARTYLIDRGYPATKVKEYPSHQVVFLKLVEKTIVFRDEALKWMMIPYWQAEDGLAEVAKVPQEVEEMICHSLGVAVGKVRSSYLRTEQRLALIRIIEAVRLNPASLKGELPKSLDDLTVPIPVDPVTGKPFKYKLDGATVFLEGREIKYNDSTIHYRFELRVRK